MNELQRALAEIHCIRSQVAHGTEFRGYGPASIAASGILALVIAGWQAFAADREVMVFPQWVVVWTAIASLIVAMTGLDMLARARRLHRGFAREMVICAAEQFLPALLVGLLFTLVVVRFLPAQAWLLPGMWQLIFSLGVFASCRFLPRGMRLVGGWYLLTGLYCLASAGMTHQISPWMMGLPFGIGQLWVAVVLHRGYRGQRDTPAALG